MNNYYLCSTTHKIQQKTEMEDMRYPVYCLTLFLVCGDLVTSLPNQHFAGKLYNSSVACTRGSQQTLHDLDCRNAEPQGMVGRMYISRIFYGVTPLSMGCDRTASFNNCCSVDLDADCIFTSDVDIEDVVRRVTGFSQATFQGLRRYSLLGNCDPNKYPDLTSYSIVEFGCASVSLLKDITADVTFQYPQVLYLDSNGFFNNSDVKDSDFHCVVQTECNSSLSVVVLFLRRFLNNSSRCAEEFFIRDGKYPDVNSNLTCRDGSLIFNRLLFTSESSVAVISMSVTGNHTGKVFIKVNSSKESSEMSLTCGAETKRILDNLERCPEDVDIAERTSVTPSTSQATNTSVNLTDVMLISTTTNANDINLGLIIGLALGVPLLLLLLFLLFCFIRQRGRQKQLEKLEPVAPTIYHLEPPSKVPVLLLPDEHIYEQPIIGSRFHSAPPPYTEHNQQGSVSYNPEDSVSYNRVGSVSYNPPDEHEYIEVVN